MQIFRATSLILLLGGLALAAPQQPPKSPQTTAAHKRRAVKTVAKPSPAIPQPAAPPPAPPTPEQMPAQAPQVGYHDGLLSINAQNSTLGDILRAVQQSTGASVDMPGGMSERVAANLGPAPPRKVLADLLLGSHYDYVILGATNDPNAVRSILLTRNTSGPALAQNAPGAASAAASPPPQVRSEDAEDDTMPPDQEAENPEEQRQPVVVPYPRHPTAPPAAPPTQPGVITGPGMPVQPNQPPGDTGQPRVKSPEELLQELQRMQQLQQQQQQQQSPQQQQQQQQQQQNPPPPPQ